MTVIRIASISFVALSILTPSANAQAPWPTITASLTQKLQPVSHSYPGVSADILGIRTGMSLSKAEAVAEKSYAGKYKPEIEHSSVTLSYSPPFGYGTGGVNVESRPFISYILFNHATRKLFDGLRLYFSSPATGNTLLGVWRRISYDYQDYKIEPEIPLVSTVKALLIRKYGPTSYQSKAQDGGLTFGWVFGEKTPKPKRFWSLLPGVVTDMDSDDGLDNFPRDCGTTASFPDLFRIDAKIDATNNGRVRDLYVMIWDAAACVKDAQEAKKQLTAAAIKYWEAKYKIVLPAD